NYVLPFPTRTVPSGRVTVAAGTPLSFSGSNGRQLRVMFVITNKSTTQTITVCQADGRDLFEVDPREKISFPTSADLIVVNAADGVDNGAATKILVAELFPQGGGGMGS